MIFMPFGALTVVVILPSTLLTCLVYAKRCGKSSFSESQITQMWRNDKFPASRRSNIYAKDVLSKPWCRSRSPTVTITATET